MQNDLIVLEFENLDGREVLLEPTMILHVSESVRQLMGIGAQQVLTQLDPASSRPIHAKVYIAAVERGSIRLGFRALIGSLTAEERQMIETAANATSIVDTVTGWIFKAGVGGLALFHVVVPGEEEKSSSVTVQMPAGMPTKEFNEAVEELVNQALAAGADQVHISAPGQPRCLLSKSKFRPDLLGSKASPIPPQLAGIVTGELRVMHPPLPFRQNGAVKQLGIGHITIERKQSGNRKEVQNWTVLLDWKSSEPYPDPANEKFPVKGQLRSLHDVDLEALAELAAEHRHVQGVLEVSAVQTISWR